MKTPREILLQKHQTVEPKLNAVRQAALARPGPAQKWRELIMSMRWHFAGLGAVWATVVLLLCLDSTSCPDTAAIARGKIPTARVLMASLLENRREIIELTEPPAPGQPAAALPPRRSEIQSAREIV